MFAFYQLNLFHRLEDNSGRHLVQPLCSNRVTHSQLCRTMSRQLSNISNDGDSTTFLGNLCYGLVTLMFRQSFSHFSSRPLPLVSTDRSLAPSSLHPSFRYFDTLMRSFLSLSFSYLTAPALSAFPHRRDAPVPSSPWMGSQPFAGLFLLVSCLSY